MKKEITDLITVDSLVRATKRMRKKRKPGMDGVTRDQFLTRIQKTDLASTIINQIACGKYRPNPLKLLHIPKANGKLREIFIPTVQDAVVQAAIVESLTPLTESRFLNNSFGFRPKRNLFGAVMEASRLIKEGYTVMYSVDLESFFPNMNRDLVRKYLRDYTLGENTRSLINSFITAKVSGPKLRYHKGVPAGLPLAPLLANMYLHSLDLLLNKMNIKYVRYADDITLFFRNVEDCLIHKNFWGNCKQRFEIVVNADKTRMYSEGYRPVLGFLLDDFGVITISRAVIDKVEKSLNGLLADPKLLLPDKIKRIRLRIIFCLKYYKDIQNFSWLAEELNLLLLRMIKLIQTQFSQFEIGDSLERPIRNLDECEFIDETEWLLDAIKP